jgi:plastocyanin
MITLTKTHKYSAILFAISFPFLAGVMLGQAEKESSAASPGHNQIVIKDFNFNPKTLTVKSGEKITWINRDEEPHTIVSVEKAFKKSSALDTDQEFTITAGAPGTYTYFCSVHPKMTGTIIVEKS